MKVAKQVNEQAAMDLVDAIVEAIDLDRRHAVDRVRGALEPFGLDAAFGDELRLCGTPSLTWNRCEFCSGLLAEVDASAEVAA